MLVCRSLSNNAVKGGNTALNTELEVNEQEAQMKEDQESKNLPVLNP